MTVAAAISESMSFLFLNMYIFCYDSRALCVTRESRLTYALSSCQVFYSQSALRLVSPSDQPSYLHVPASQ